MEVNQYVCGFGLNFYLSYLCDNKADVYMVKFINTFTDVGFKMIS